ncbi:hypothetical protein J6590_073081 [Homalodisca vitripennis]|nr:hypothetical protein J6590_073081 [Homalodisca vitripennis]
MALEMDEISQLVVTDDCAVSSDLFYTSHVNYNDLPTSTLQGLRSTIVLMESFTIKLSRFGNRLSYEVKRQGSSSQNDLVTSTLQGLCCHDSIDRICYYQASQFHCLQYRRGNGLEGNPYLIILKLTSWSLFPNPFPTDNCYLALS